MFAVSLGFVGIFIDTVIEHSSKINLNFVPVAEFD